MKINIKMKPNELETYILELPPIFAALLVEQYI